MTYSHAAVVRDLSFTVHVEDGSYWATVAEYPGIFASGFDLEELRESLEEGIALYLWDDEGPVPAVSLGELRLSEMPAAALLTVAA